MRSAWLPLTALALVLLACPPDEEVPYATRFERLDVRARDVPRVETADRCAIQCSGWVFFPTDGWSSA